MLNIKKTPNILRNAPRKLVSLFIGYHVWLIIGSWLPTTRWLEVPLCFYNISAGCSIRAPESITVALSGDRTNLYHLDTSRLAVHIDSQGLALGTHAINISRESLMLPNNIHVARQSPSNLMISVHQQELKA